MFCNQSSLPYDRFAKELGISIAGEKLDCRDMQSFSAQVRIEKHISSPIPRGRPTRPSTGRRSRVVVWWVGRLPSPPWWRATTTSAWPPLPGWLTGVQQAPSLLPYSPTHLLGSLVNTATKNLVETTKYINAFTLSLTLVWKVEASEEIDAVLQSGLLSS